MRLLGTVIRTSLVKVLDYEKDFICNQCKTVFSIQVHQYQLLINIMFQAAAWQSVPSARQHPSYGDFLEVKTEYYQNCSVLDCVTQCSQSAAHLYEQFLQVQQIGFVTLGPLRHG